MTVDTARPRRVLFVCIENSNRSQMAEAFARLDGGGTVEAYSAGSRPSGVVNPRAVEFMAKSATTCRPTARRDWQTCRSWSSTPRSTMGCGDACPMVKAGRHEDWGIPDPKHLPPEEFRAIRDLIRAKVKELLASLNDCSISPSPLGRS